MKSIKKKETIDLLSIDMLIELLTEKKTSISLAEKSVRSDWTEFHENNFCDEETKNFFNLIRGLN